MWDTLETAEKPTYYERLRVASTASSAEIRAAYRALAWQWHPDRSGALAMSPQSVIPDRSQQMAKINTAYDVLRDPRRRAIYDEMLRIASLQLPTSVGMKAKSPLQMLARFAQQSKQLPQLWASRGWRQRVVQIKRWTMMGTLIASLAFVALWLVDLLGASDREMMLAFRTTPALAPDNEVLPHLLDGDPLPLKLSLRLNTPPSRNATHVSLP